MTTNQTTTSTQPNPSAGTRAAALAHQILTNAPRGQLTLLDGAALDPCGGWTGLGTALSEQTAAGAAQLLTSELGDRIGVERHPLSTALHGDGVLGLIDWNSDLWLPMPSWDDPNIEWDENLPDELPQSLNGFGNPSITTIARNLARTQPADGLHPLILVRVNEARPYQEIMRRLSAINESAARKHAIDATLDWLAADLAVFASTRPTDATIIASDRHSPEWPALTQHAATTLPSPHVQQSRPPRRILQPVSEL